MVTENLSALKINKLTRDQFANALAAGNIKDNELYMTPDIEGSDIANTNTSVWSNITVSTSQWSSSTTYPQYPFRATLTFQGCNATYIPEVFPSADAIDLGILAPIAETGTNCVYLYASEKPTVSIKINHIIFTKNKGSSFVGEEVEPEFLVDLKNDIDELMALVKTKPSYYVYNVTLTTSWTSSKTQTISLEGILSTDTPTIDLICTPTGYEAEQTEWAKVYRAETKDGSIVFYASEATTKALTLQVKVFRVAEGTEGLFAWKKYKV